MNFPSLRSMVSAVVKPGLRALQCLYDHQVKYMVGRLTRQDEVIRATQTQVAELSTKVIELSEKILQLAAQCQVLKENLYTSQEVAILDGRVKDVNILVTALYAKMLELIISGKVSDPTVPDLNHTSRDRQYTEAELISYWKVANRIKDGEPMTTSQQLAMQAFLDAHKAAHPVNA